MNSRKDKAGIIAAVICVLFIAVCFVIRGINRSSNYSAAVEYLKEGDYTSALEIFENLGSYRDSRQLKNYALALQSADSGGLSAHILARTYISRISESYNGELSEQIREFKAASVMYARREP